MSFSSTLIAILILLVLAVGLYIYYRIKKDVDYITKMRKLDLKKLGFDNMPAVPFSIPDTLETIVQLGLRTEECKMAKQGLSNKYKLEDGTHSAYTFMYDDQSHDTSKEARKKLEKKLKHTIEEELILTGQMDQMLVDAGHIKIRQPIRPLMDQFLQSPDQFSIGWTNYYDVYKNSHSKIKEYASVLTDADAATDQFWPMIAENGMAYNLLFLNKVKDEEMEEIIVNFKIDEENNYLSEIQQDGRLYAIDLRIFEKWDSQQVNGFQRWTPGSWILLEQNKEDKKLKPVSVRVSVDSDSNKEAVVYHRSDNNDSAWIFALTAARCSVTVYGIWLGHVYHWHIVTAAMQMTMFENMEPDHPIRKLMDPQSKSLIGFNDTLFLLWSTIGPPTSFSTTESFLELTNTFADGREFFDDDPLVALEKLGLDVEDFTDKEAWDRYPIVKDLLTFWTLANDFATAFVDATFPDDEDVSNDQPLQDWMEASSDPDHGNVRGLPYMSSKRELTRVLSSLIYRVVVHGNSRQMKSLNAALCFVSNYPPCLQDTQLPKASDKISLDKLMKYLPNTGTIGEMMTFYYIFIYSAPKDQLMPLFGNDTSLYFEGGAEEPRNKALIAFRDGVDEFLETYMGGENLMHQWPASIET